MRTSRVLVILVAVLLPLLVLARPASAEEATVTVEGPHVAGRWVLAHVSGAVGDISYAWTVDGEPTPSVSPVDGLARSPKNLFLLEEFIGREVAVTVVITSPTGDPLSLTTAFVVAGGGVMPRNDTTVDWGSLLVGETLTATHGVVYPLDGYQVAYQWFHSQSIPILGATLASLTLTREHLGLWGLRVRATVSKPGWTDSVSYSTTNWGYVLPGSIQPGTASLAAVPRSGETLWLTEKGWPEAEPLDTVVDWLLDGRVVARTTGSISLEHAWVGKELRARMTKSRAGVASVTVTTPPAVVLPGHEFNIKYVRGHKSVVGWTLRTDDVPNAPGLGHTVNWFRVDASGREAPIPGVVGLEYRLTRADIGFKIGARGVLTTADGQRYDTWKDTYAVPVAFNVYTTPGEHTLNGRQWRTTCEKYSQTQRCRTEIVATQVAKVGGRWTQRTGWVFNNLTYLPLSAPHAWGANRLANTVEWTDEAGRQWRTDCNPKTAGYNTCRTYITAHVTQAYPMRWGGWTYQTTKEWVFNNMLYYE